MLRLFKTSTLALNKSITRTSALSRQNLFSIQKASFSTKPPGQDNKDSSSSASRYKDAFENLKAKINPQHAAGDDKLSEGDNITEMAKNTYSKIKYGQDNIDPAAKDEFETAKKLQAEDIARREAEAKARAEAELKAQSPNAQAQTNTTGQQTQQQTVHNTATASTTEAGAAKTTTTQETKTEEKAPSKSWKEMLSEKAPFLGKAADYVVDSWQETFPSDTYRAKQELIKKQAKERAEQEKNMKEFTEEELTQIQDQIPEWKRTSLASYGGDQPEEDNSIRTKVTGALKDKFNQTTMAKTLYESEHYKEYTEFKKEMSQFKEDLNDHLSQSQNPAVIASMAIYSKVTSESSTAAAIREVKKYIKDFDPFELERESEGIFTDVYNAFLRHDRAYIEATCEDMALAYFKTLLKKREIDGVYPKYEQLWSHDRCDFIGGRINENNKPCFTYSIQIQQVNCNISKKTEKIVDGAEDQVLQHRYNFVLALHDTPDLENVGHPWVIIECLPVEAVAMLA